MFPQIFGKYVLEREIAAGGMARVYLATLRGAVGFEKRLVVKQIRTELASDEAFVTRFVEEAKTAVELSHPNIVPVYELGVEQGVYYIAMELCEGLTLSEVLAETGPLGPAEGAFVGAEICRALDYAHRRAHIVHRDVTPRNVLIDDEGAVRLIDFGIAAPVSHADDATRSEVFGSPGHMPPEQLHGAELSPATDVFAVGVLLIEVWTGYPPFRRATAQESERALFTVPPPIDRREPLLAPLRQLIASSVALDPRARPSAAEHLARPLREFLKTEDTGDIARRLADRVQRARRRLRSSSPWLPGERGGDELARQTRPFSSAPPAPREPAEPGSAPATRTFAARGDLEVWTRKLSSAPAPLLATPADPPRSRELSAEKEGSDAAPSEQEAREPSGISSSKPSGAAKWPRELAVLGGASFAFLALAFALGPRAREPHSDAARSKPAAAATPGNAQPTLTAALDPPARPVSSAITAGHHSASVVHSATQRPAAVPLDRGPSPVSSAPAEFGVLKITADPRANVVLTGPNFRQVGQSPMIGLKVPAGRYQVLFRNDTFGAPLNAQVTVASGMNRSVHADFRQAEPAVSVR
jgi:serine/threonine-protein kinase